MELDQMLHAVRSGELSANVFFSKTETRWVKMAAYLMKRWKAPYWFELEELAQECRYWGFKYIEKYDASKDINEKGIWNYVATNAIDKGKKRLHQVRGVNLHRNADKQPSVRIELLDGTRHDRRERSMNRFEQHPEQSENLTTLNRSVPWNMRVYSEADIDSMMNYEAAIAACDNSIERMVIRIIQETECIGAATAHVSKVRGITTRRARAIVAQATKKVEKRIAARAA